MRDSANASITHRTIGSGQFWGKIANRLSEIHDPPNHTFPRDTIVDAYLNNPTMEGSPHQFGFLNPDISAVGTLLECFPFKAKFVEFLLNLVRQ